MRPAFRRLAESLVTSPLNLKDANATLYPPIPYGLRLPPMTHRGSVLTFSTGCTEGFCEPIDFYPRR
jgi:hypothetical protein